MSFDFNKYEDSLSITYSPYNSTVGFIFDDLNEKVFMS